MKKVPLFFLAILLSSLIYSSCSKGSTDNSNPAPPSNPCDGVTISITGTTANTTSGQNNGSITVTATGGSGFTYSLNNGTFQASGTFSNLAAGAYTVTAKNSNGCTGSQSFTVGASTACTGANITVTTSAAAATPCAASPNGSVTVTASGSTAFTYNINGGAFQASNQFNGLAAGTYTVSAKDANGCSQSAAVTVGAAAAGARFSAVRTVVQTFCAVSGCHLGSAPAGGINFSVDCNIVANKDRMKARAVDAAGTANQMPQPPNAPLSAADQQKIVDWINAGGTYSN